MQWLSQYKGWTNSALEEGILVDELNVMYRCKGTFEAGDKPTGIKSEIHSVIKSHRKSLSKITRHRKQREVLVQ